MQPFPAPRQPVRSRAIMTDAPKKNDRYRDTVFLPTTDFPMRAGLPQKEPEILKRWAEMNLFGLLREQSKGREKFVLHDGPPYANGNIHIGHALNKTLKDLVVRSAQMSGYDANYVPGWDCHGLPIEWKIEEQYRAKGKNKDAVPINEFRKECREFAKGWIDVQREEFKRLGVEGDWDNPYLTMNYKAEAIIARELMKFADSDQLYRGSKPVMWSVVEKTALAEAEIEYADYVSDAIYVKFPVSKIDAALDKLAIEENHGMPASKVGTLDHAVRSESLTLVDASVVIWTTTPWTIPGNRAVSYSKKIKYSLYQVELADADNWAGIFDRYVLAENTAEAFFKSVRVEKYSKQREVGADELASLELSHPLKSLGYDFPVPLLDGDHVTDDAGTGFVHTAPGHGADDYIVWTANQKALRERGINTDIPTTVNADGFLTNEAPGLTGKRVITDKGEKGDANEAVIAALKEAGNIVGRSRLTHQYPHSWRSKKPIIFRNTPQWFISMGDGKVDGLRAKALAAIEATEFFPASGQNRLRGMIEQRPDWVISRQRAWGVPIAVFVEKATGKILNDNKVNQRVYDSFVEEGADAWFADGAAERFLSPDYKAADYEQVRDILDVWFDSGCTHAFTLEERPELQWPANVYLEGSDQHRGWFHSSLLESCGTRGVAPYKQVITHGFTMAEDGRKMSKSLGNTVVPQDVIKTSGADILRLWVASTDYADDQRVGPEILKGTSENYRKLRNTFRYMLGAVDGLKDWEQVYVADMPELERYVLHLLWTLDQTVREAYRVYDYKKVTASLMQFMNTDLSAFYFDIRKDALYCDPWSSLKRRSCRTVIDQLFHCLTTWWAPILVFTTEEAWLQRFAGEGSSVHLMQFAKTPDEWRDKALGEKWNAIRKARSVVTGALELKRAEKVIGSSLEAEPEVYIHGLDKRALADLTDPNVDFAEVCITSGLTILNKVGPREAFRGDFGHVVTVVIKKAKGAKCARSWKISKDVGQDAEFPDITPRDAEAVREWQTRFGKTV
jgi:isoleucyl-tRNA synthetase